MAGFASAYGHALCAVAINDAIDGSFTSARERKNAKKDAAILAAYQAKQTHLASHKQSSNTTSPPPSYKSKMSTKSKLSYRMRSFFSS